MHFPTSKPTHWKYKHKARSWNDIDDALLVEAVENESINMETGEVEVYGAWTRVAQAIRDAGMATCERTQVACRKRYVEHLRPGLRTDKVTNKEKYILLLALEKINEQAGLPLLGRPPRGTWNQLVHLFPGRTQLDLRNVYSIFHRKPMTHEKKVSSRMDFRVDSEMEGDLWGTDDEIWGRVTASLAALDAKRKDKKRQKRRESMDDRNLKLRRKREAKQSNEAMSEVTLNHIYCNFLRDHITTDLPETTDVDLEDLLWLENYADLVQFAKALLVDIRADKTKDGIVMQIYNAAMADDSKMTGLLGIMNEKCNNQYSFVALEESKELQELPLTPTKKSRKTAILISPSRQ